MQPEPEYLCSTVSVIGRGDDRRPTRLDQIEQRSSIVARRIDMLDHFQADHDGEAAILQSQIIIRRSLFEPEMRVSKAGESDIRRLLIIGEAGGGAPMAEHERDAA